MFPRTYSFTGGNLQDLGRETYGALDTEVLVLGTVDEIGRDWSMHQIQNEFGIAGSKKDDQRTFLQILDIATSERDANLVYFSTSGAAGFTKIFFTLSDVAHVNREPEGDYSYCVNHTQ